MVVPLAQGKGIEMGMVLFQMMDIKRDVFNISFEQRLEGC